MKIGVLTREWPDQVYGGDASRWALGFGLGLPWDESAARVGASVDGLFPDPTPADGVPGPGDLPEKTRRGGDRSLDDDASAEAWLLWIDRQCCGVAGRDERLGQPQRGHVLGERLRGPLHGLYPVLVAQRVVQHRSDEGGAVGPGEPGAEAIERVLDVEERRQAAAAAEAQRQAAAAAEAQRQAAAAAERVRQEQERARLEAERDVVAHAIVRQMTATSSDNVLLDTHGELGAQRGPRAGGSALDRSPP